MCILVTSGLGLNDITAGKKSASLITSVIVRTKLANFDTFMFAPSYKNVN